MRAIWLVAGLVMLRQGSYTPAREALRNTLRRQPPAKWRTGVVVVEIHDA